MSNAFRNIYKKELSPNDPKIQLLSFELINISIYQTYRDIKKKQYVV